MRAWARALCRQYRRTRPDDRSRLCGDHLVKGSNIRGIDGPGRKAPRLRLRPSQRVPVATAGVFELLQRELRRLAASIAIPSPTPLLSRAATPPTTLTACAGTAVDLYPGCHQPGGRCARNRQPRADTAGEGLERSCCAGDGPRMPGASVELHTDSIGESSECFYSSPVNLLLLLALFRAVACAQKLCACARRGYWW